MFSLICSFIITCYAVFDWYSWVAWSFLKVNGEGVDPGEWEDGVGRGMGSYGQGIKYKRINKKETNTNLEGWLEGYRGSSVK